MEILKKFWWVGLLAILIFWVIGKYNGIAAKDQEVKRTWGDVESDYQRRSDLIPNLVETVKGYASHESGVFEEVTKARAQAIQATGLEQKAEAENALSGTLKSLFAVSEAYPDLKANQNFLELQRELSDTENKIQASRRFYNSIVLSLNTKVESFPDSFIASSFGFEKKEYFEIAEAEKEVVKVSF
jgi:LemA protein